LAVPDSDEVYDAMLWLASEDDELLLPAPAPVNGGREEAM